MPENVHGYDPATTNIIALRAKDRGDNTGLVVGVTIDDPGQGDPVAVPAGSTNGSALTVTTGIQAVIFYLQPGDSVTGIVASAQPISAPAAIQYQNTSGATSTKIFIVALNNKQNFYVTAKTGSPVYRTF